MHATLSKGDACYIVKGRWCLLWWRWASDGPSLLVLYFAPCARSMNTIAHLIRCAQHPELPAHTGPQPACMHASVLHGGALHRRLRLNCSVPGLYCMHAVAKW